MLVTVCADDIDAVKAEALRLIETVYGTDDAPKAGRIGIVTFYHTGEIAPC